MSARQKKRELEEEIEKQKMLNRHKWELVRAQREVMLKYKRQLMLKMERLSKLCVHITLNRIIQTVHSNFLKLKAKKKED